MSKVNFLPQIEKLTLDISPSFLFMIAATKNGRKVPWTFPEQNNPKRKNPESQKW